jgi:hypothetical protein
MRRLQRACPCRPTKTSPNSLAGLFRLGWAYSRASRSTTPRSAGSSRWHSLSATDAWAFFGPRTTAALLALSGIVAVYVIPNLKYPANPPSVGDPETITSRTELYFSMIAISLAAMIAAWMLRSRLVSQFGGWNAAIIAVAAYLVVVIVAALALPSVNEVPEGFPAVVLWQFRMASVGAQAIMWTTIGLAFGALTERAASTSKSGLRLNTATR